MPVHHIHMHPIRTLILNRATLCAEVGEVGGQDGRRNQDGSRGGQGSPMVCFVFYLKRGQTSQTQCTAPEKTLARRKDLLEHCSVTIELFMG